MLRLSNFNYTWSSRRGRHQSRRHPRHRRRPVVFPRTGLHGVARNLPQPDARIPATPIRTACWCSYAYDWTGDGWPDVLMGSTLYINPGQGAATLGSRCRPACSRGGEISAFNDIDGDGKTDVINSSGAGVSFSHPDPANPLGPVDLGERVGPGPVGRARRRRRRHQRRRQAWTSSTRTAGGSSRRRRRTDAVEVPRREASAGWAGRRRPGGAEMVVYDVNGDGKNDIVTSLRRTGGASAWFEQKRDAAGEISFVAAHDHGRLPTKNPGDVTFSELARPDRRRHGRRRHPGLRRRQALLVAPGELRRSGPDGRAGALRLQDRSQPTGARAAPSSCRSSSTTAPAPGPRCSRPT